MHMAVSCNLQDGVEQHRIVPLGVHNERQHRQQHAVLIVRRESFVIDERGAQPRRQRVEHESRVL